MCVCGVLWGNQRKGVVGEKGGKKGWVGNFCLTHHFWHYAVIRFGLSLRRKQWCRVSKGKFFSRKHIRYVGVQLKGWGRGEGGCLGVSEEKSCFGFMTRTCDWFVQGSWGKKICWRRQKLPDTFPCFWPHPLPSWRAFGWNEEKGERGRQLLWSGKEILF